MNSIRSILILLTMSVVISGCNRDTDYVVTIKTSYGDMVAVLYEETPLHKENFIKLALEGQYDSTIFHRIMNEFMIQGGDVNRKEGSAGKIEYTVPAEFRTDLFHRKGALAAARQADQFNPTKASSGSQFYIVQGKIWNEAELTTDMNKLNAAVGTLIRLPEYDSIGKELIACYQRREFDRYNEMLIGLRPAVESKLGQDVTKKIRPERLEIYTTTGGAPWLDDDYTVFGQVVKGLDIVDKIATVPTGPGDLPLDNIYMEVSVEELPKKEITKLYGVEYPSK